MNISLAEPVDDLCGWLVFLVGPKALEIESF
jgi:hypothetical protein